MAQDNDSERTESASPRRLEQAREQGDVPRVPTLLNAPGEPADLLFHLGAALAQTGRTVLLLDAVYDAEGIAATLGKPCRHSLLEFARQNCALERTVRRLQPSLGIASLGLARLERVTQAESRRLETIIALLLAKSDFLLTHAQLDFSDALPLSRLESGEIVVQCTGATDSVTQAYAQLKRLQSRLGREQYGLIVTQAHDASTQRICSNLGAVAKHHLGARMGRALTLAFTGSPTAQAVRQLTRLLSGDFQSDTHEASWSASHV